MSEKPDPKPAREHSVNDPERLQGLAGALESQLERALPLGAVYFVAIGNPYGPPDALKVFTNAPPELVDQLLKRWVADAIAGHYPTFAERGPQLNPKK